MTGHGRSLQSLGYGASPCCLLLASLLLFPYCHRFTFTRRMPSSTGSLPRLYTPHPNRAKDVITKPPNGGLANGGHVSLNFAHRSIVHDHVGLRPRIGVLLRRHLQPRLQRFLGSRWQVALPFAPLFQSPWRTHHILDGNDGPDRLFLLILRWLVREDLLGLSTRAVQPRWKDRSPLALKWPLEPLYQWI